MISCGVFFLEEKGEAILSVIFNEVTPTLQDTLEESIRERDFQFMYQPIVNIKNRGIGLEMLARWQHKGEWISPVLFMPVIEKERLISSIAGRDSKGDKGFPKKRKSVASLWSALTHQNILHSP